MTLSTIISLISAHWHKVVAVIAFFLALYNKFSHDKKIDQLVNEAINKLNPTSNMPTPSVSSPIVLPPPIVSTPKKKHRKKHKKHKNK